MNQTIRSRDFHVSVEPKGDQPPIILAEFVEQWGGGDCPQFDPEEVLAAELMELSPQQAIHKKATHFDTWFIGLRFRTQIVRWTIFSPGRTITTVYPEGFGKWDAGSPHASTLRPRLAWVVSPYGDDFGEVAGYFPMSRTYSIDAAQANLSLVLRPLNIALRPQRVAHVYDNQGPMSNPPAALCEDDARLFTWQLDRLDSAIVISGASKQLSAETRQRLMDTVDQEFNALKLVPMPDVLRQKLEEQVGELRNHLVGTK